MQYITFPDGRYSFWMVFKKRHKHGTILRVHENTCVEERIERLATDEGTRNNPRIQGSYNRWRPATKGETRFWLRMHYGEEDTPLDHPVPALRYRLAVLLDEDRRFMGEILNFEDGRQAIRDMWNWPWFQWTHCNSWVSPKIYGTELMTPAFLRKIKKMIARGRPTEFRMRRYQALMKRREC